MYEYNLGIRFETTASRRAEAAAIWFNEQEVVNYAELNRLANQTARWLLVQGIGRSDVLCLSGEKSLITFAIMLACLKIGAAYSVLDPETPVERLRKILGTCEPKLLLAGRELLNKADDVVAELSIGTTEKDSVELTRIVGCYEGSNLLETRAVTGDNPAYIMFTSGSTGIPKGAVMTHANVLNLIDWGRETFGIFEEDRLTNVNPLYFDNSVFDFYTALFIGALLVPFSKDETRDPKLLIDKVGNAGCTLWFSVPSLLIFLQTMRAADGKNLGSIRRFVFGGEGYPKAKLKKLFEAYGDSSELFNVYGPTECTCICSAYKVTERDFEDLQALAPLGHLADNFAYLILSVEGDKVPAGESGELCLLGPNVSKGYYNDPERTAASFVQNPYNRSFRELMYRTGDLVRFEPADGKLYILGRKDNQIKHMGYRVELEEIEAALNCLDYVSEAAAMHTNVNGLSRIVAVLAAHREFDDEKIRHDLKNIIPEYMIPSVYYREDLLPKNANGKVDRRRLADRYLGKIQ